MQARLRCWAEVDLQALRENLAWIRHRVGAGIELLTVVKADAYGHGLKQIAGLLMQGGTDVFGVANLTEARAIRSVGRGWPILMLGPCLPGEIGPVIRDDVMPSLSNAVEAQAFSEAAARVGKTIAVHVKVDTGMGRMGVRLEEAADLVALVHDLPGLRLAGVYSHFASVEDDAEFTRRQREQMRRLVSELKRRKLPLPAVHLSNSGGILLERGGRFGMVRPGALVYGVVPTTKRRIAKTLRRRLRPALSWKSRVGLVRELQPGDSVSYGRSFIAERPLLAATLTVGYGDGLMRAAGNRAGVLIRGTRCRVLGRVTMDQTVVDVSELPEVAVGDEAVLIGEQGGASITANELAEWCGTIPWEVLTNITHRVPRVYLGGHAA